MTKSKLRIIPILFMLTAALLVSGCFGLLDLPELTEDTQTPAETEPTAPPATATLEASPVPAGQVTELGEVKQAVIQIEAQGTFVDPEFGEYSGAGRGSGFIIDPSGLAVTNNHVVTGAALIKVWVGGETDASYNARILAVSECSDLALIDLEGEGYPYLSWYDGPVEVGLEVYAAGFPLGDPEYTLTKGIVSKENADGDTSWASVKNVIEHDATINPGNSGGPLVNAQGQVVGVNYATYSEANQYFAIGRESTQAVLEKLRTGENVDSLGINGYAVSSEDGTLSGIWVSSVESGSPAEDTDIQPGDLITSMENLPLGEQGTMANYCDIIRTQGADSTLAVEVYRMEENQTFSGQINGDQLAAVNPPEEEASTVVSSEEEIITLSDNTGALVMDVPGSWNETDGRIWEASWGDLDFVAASIQAAPDLDAFKESYVVSGVDFSASRDWGDIGGYIGLLDGTKHWYQDVCDLEGRYDYEDEVYEGKYDLWECGSEEAVVVLSARPIDNPTAFLTLVQVQVVNDRDLDALEIILASFDVVDTLP